MISNAAAIVELLYGDSSDDDNDYHNADSEDESIWLPAKIRKEQSVNMYTAEDRHGSLFYSTYIAPATNINGAIHDEMSPEGKKFRRRFRVPYALFQ